MEFTGYELSRNWFDFCFKNPEKISPNHTAIYFFAIEHCNRLGWKEKFGFPTQMAMDAIGIKKHGTYIRYFMDLCEWGFFKMVQKSTNQYSANIISLSSALPKNGKALDKAIITHAAKQIESNGQSTGQSNSSIDKQQTTNHITNNHEQEKIIFTIEHCLTVAMNDPRWVDANKATRQDLETFNKLLEKRGEYEKNPMDYKKHYANWAAGGKKDESSPVIGMSEFDKKLLELKKAN